MLDDPKSLTRYEAPKLIPVRGELLTRDDLNERIDKVEESSQIEGVYTLTRALELAGLTKSSWDSMVVTCKNRGYEYEIDRVEYIRQRFENRIFESALTNKTNATMAIFALKNNHGWSDKQNIEIQATQTTKVDVSDMDEELKRQLAERYLNGSVLDEGH